ncbi:MAG: amidohydrolase, partial [Gammaproteobacteria bacterium]|nr:amidohydrolase [Gammaproteobacteria bacterium]
PSRPYAEAVAIRGDTIMAVGSRAEASAAVGAGAETIDLGGRFLMPGLIDSHCHALYGGLGLVTADNADRAQSVDELATFAADARASGRGMFGDVLFVTGVPLAMWTRVADLAARFDSGDYISQPVVLQGMDGHTAWANRAMRARAGIDRQLLAGLDAATRTLFGQDADGEPNGLLAEAAMEQVSTLIPQPDDARMREAGRAAVEYLHAAGITSWLDPSTDDTMLRTYRMLSERGELDSRVVALPVVDFRKGDEDRQLAAALRQREAFRDLPDVRIGGIKVFADGVAEYPTQTAHMSKPYLESGLNGELMFDPERFADIAIAADRQGMIVHVHAIGDQAVTEALDGIEAARRANGDSGLLHSITHLQFIRPDDMPRFRELGVIASFQLYWARGSNTTIDLLKPYVDPGLYEWQYPARSLLDAGGTIAGASDWNVSTPNVFHAIYRAETRNGPKGVLDPDQRVPREAMLYAYTRDAAKLLGEEHRIGSIAPGKFADLVLLDRDLLTVSAEEARDTTVLWTLVGGRGVFGGPPAP